MMPVVFETPRDMLGQEGLSLGASDWMTVEQSMIDAFADLTGDHQWIHVDPERAASGLFGACIAHGYLTLALANLFMPQLMQFENLAMGVNYGSDRLRFPAPVKVGSRIRGHGQLVRVEMQGQAVQAVVRMSVEIEGSERPGCVVDTISRYTFNPLEK